MAAIFLKLLNMSITASWLVVAVILLRLIFKKAPKIISLILWALVGIRLILPFSLESTFSLVPNELTVPSGITSSTTIPPADNTLPTLPSGNTSEIVPGGVTTIDPNTTPTIPQSPGAVNGATAMQTALYIMGIVWAAGVAAMLIYALVSYIRLRLKVREAVKSEGNILVCDGVASPFILGIIRPKIYLPSSIDIQDIHYVLAHENAHLKRRDHLWKPLGFLLLSVYWFNPVLWVAYILLCRDIELACDEKVIKSLGIEAKKPYSTALVNCSVPRRAVAVCPLAFGEVGVKKRVKTVLNYKKPAFWVIIIALLLCVAVAVCFLTTQPSDPTNPNDNTTTTTNPDSDKPTPDTKEPITTDPNNTKIVSPTLSWTGNFTKDPFLDIVECDIDGDGKAENVRIYNGTTENSYVIAAWQSYLEYFATINLENKATWAFDGYADGVLKIKQTMDGTSTTLKLTAKNGELILEGENIESVKHNNLINVLDRASQFRFDVDADGLKERCIVVPDTEDPTTFKFIVAGSSEELIPEYYNVFSYDGIDKLTFIVNDAGRIVLEGKKNGSTVTYDIRVENGIIILTEQTDGSTLPYVNKAFGLDTWSHVYDFDLPNSSMYYDVDGDGKNETIYLGYSLNIDEMVVAYDYVICVTDGERYAFFRSTHQTIIEKEDDGKVYLYSWNDYYEEWHKIGLLMMDEDGNYEFNGEAVGLLPI
ncbi:MAG: hypothetical protein IKU25_05820 [Clostridia bacterium]|nr:hypothetical protein [Clostridia bacterium]